MYETRPSGGFEHHPGGQLGDIGFEELERAIERSLRLALQHGALAPRQARRAVEELLGDNVEIAFIRDALLLTSEIVTNAVEHTHDGCDLRATFDGRRQYLKVAIVDTSSTTPTMRPLDSGRHARRGRGMWVVNDVAHRWGVEAGPDGKTVWFELLLDPSEQRQAGP
jgi:anti-sigma regulatory factor (Ser/Thr protein kinase)